MIDRRSLFLAAAAVVALLAATLLLSGLGGGFMLDDRQNIQENGAVHITDLRVESLLGAAYSFQPGHGTRPLAMLSFALDHWLAGLNPTAFKSTNLLIHALTVLALALLFRRLLRLVKWRPRQAAWGALALAAIWAIHPLQVSSVLYVVQRMQTLGTLFLVLALWAYLGARSAQLEGKRSRTQLMLTGLFWVLALAAKEDSILLPAYALALELTVLRFRAEDPALAVNLRRGYAFAVATGALLYALVVVPHYWNWDYYPGRVFSTPERLLTQGRVLVMYIGQILLPLSDRLPFFYDDLPISRGWLSPVTTLPAWGFVLALLALAWSVRGKRPLLACGVFLFFAGHFVTSNVIGLEMAFEHRNHFPLIGAVLALGDLTTMVAVRLCLQPALVGLMASMVFVGLGSATVNRAHAWGDPLRFAEYGVKVSPESERAWLALGNTYAGFAGQRPDSPYLQQAIDVSQEGARRLGSALLLSNVVNYKTIQGSVTSRDWEQFHQRLAVAPRTSQNKNFVWVMIRNAKRGIPMDEAGMLETFSTLSSREALGPRDKLRVAAYLYGHTQFPDEALPYLESAVRGYPADDPEISRVLDELAASGSEGWAEHLRAIRGVPE